ncbi:hypothetical protein [Clostridium estertheticum]|uniref:hypothetical protein n=1 Tax=Clostridium estertheticum TaxID=238834 RepID=UPI001C0E1FFB|nr:hypothetical protein [Clostridium estertheticum]MBU3073867.1 hypothetical protein [Clostridium estertheticum]MBU3163962.1 hypothetical protein [Clostridium estertheticum]
MDITEDRRKEIRQAISIAKQKVNEAEDEGIVIECDSYSNEDSDTTDANNDALVETVSAILVVVAAYGIYKATPYIKCWWNDKAVSSLNKMRNKVIGKTEKMNKATDREPSDLKED